MDVFAKFALKSLFYQLVTSFRAEDYNTISARKPVNINKNRNNDIVPMECFRVHLTPKPGIDGSDYINATWLIGYHKMREFIITQTPLENTIMDFWQMVWDHSAQTVVLLTSTESQVRRLSFFLLIFCTFLTTKRKHY
mgnify:FL=1